MQKNASTLSWQIFAWIDFGEWQLLQMMIAFRVVFTAWTTRKCEFLVKNRAFQYNLYKFLSFSILDRLFCYIVTNLVNIYENC